MISTYKNITLDMFPTCTLTVHYEYRQCNWEQPYKTQWRIASIHINNFYDCIDLLLWFYFNDSLLSSEKYRNLKDMIIQKLSLTDFEAWYASAPQ